MEEIEERLQCSCAEDLSVSFRGPTNDRTISIIIQRTQFRGELCQKVRTNGLHIFNLAEPRFFFSASCCLQRNQNHYFISTVCFSFQIYCPSPLWWHDTFKCTSFMFLSAVHMDDARSLHTCRTYGATDVEHTAMHVDCGTFCWFVAWCRVDKMRSLVFFFSLLCLCVSSDESNERVASVCRPGIFINSHADIMATKIINRSKFVGYVKCCVN